MTKELLLMSIYAASVAQFGRYEKMKKLPV